MFDSVLKEETKKLEIVKNPSIRKQWDLALEQMTLIETLGENDDVVVYETVARAGKSPGISFALLRSWRRDVQGFPGFFRFLLVVFARLTPEKVVCFFLL